MSHINYQDFPILVVSIGEHQTEYDPYFCKLCDELALNNYHFIHIKTANKMLASVKTEVGLGGVIINIWDDCNISEYQSFIQKIIGKIRLKNKKIPIFFIANSPLLEKLSIDIIKEIHEYMNLAEDTPKFIAGRVQLAVNQYIKNFLPPYFKALKNYVTDSPYYWDCPGHQGGVAYLKHPIGKEFINYFGENIMRADIGIATPALGDWLGHKGPPAESEERAAKIFGADKTYYVTGGSSQSNQIVGHSIYLKDKVVFVDRNCHKSVNHELTVTNAVPVYFQPSRNGFGIIGLISPDQFEEASIQKQLKSNALAANYSDGQKIAYSIVTNCTYDGLIYDVLSVNKKLKESVLRIKFDEAWYAYAKFNPLYKGRFAMDIPCGENQPTIYAVQSTHKMLAAFSSASMIHIKNSKCAPVDYDLFNQSFMMHGTTSPFYPIIASIDVATAMMEGSSGESLLNEAISNAIDFRKTVVKINNELKARNQNDWFFDIWQPETTTFDGKTTAFIDVPNDNLIKDPHYWHLKSGEKWHGFGEIPEGYAMLDPIKVTITCPGINAQGEMSEFGIPALVVYKYLDTKRTIPARNGDYNILILFALGSTQGKWSTLIDLLMVFKHHHDQNTSLKEVLPEIYNCSKIYQKMGLADLCREIHQAKRELNIAKLSDKACATLAVPMLTPAKAFECLISGKTELVEISNIKNRILGEMITPYPPGIPVIMPGEKVTEESQAIIDYLLALQEFGKRFPGFEHGLQGIKISDDGNYFVKCIKED